MTKKKVSSLNSTTSASDVLIGNALISAFGIDRVSRNADLAPLTTFRVGGRADWFVEACDAKEIIRAVGLASRLGIKITFLGGGSNVLIGELGIRGLVIRIWRGEAELVKPNVIRVNGGLSLNGLVRWTLNRGLAGLERWAGTPGTIGGGVYGNAHFKGELLGSNLFRASLVDRQGDVHTVFKDKMEFGYDSSRLQRTGEALLWAEFKVSREDPSRLRELARESLVYRKRTQPLASPSAGCIFRNPDLIDKPMHESAGALIDRAGLKGRSIGGAMVSPVHGNFIVSNGNASPSDILRLIELCREEVLARFGLVLKDEIVRLGDFEG